MPRAELRRHVAPVRCCSSPVRYPPFLVLGPPPGTERALAVGFSHRPRAFSSRRAPPTAPSATSSRCPRRPSPLQVVRRLNTERARQGIATTTWCARLGVDHATLIKEGDIRDPQVCA